MADFKNRVQELSSDASFVIFEHQTWDLEGGVNVYWFLLGIGLKLKIGFKHVTTLKP